MDFVKSSRTLRPRNLGAKALREDPQFRQQKHKSKKEVLRRQTDRESRLAIKEFLDGEE
jgi:hypothetical protein